jgi:hypothetical protein
MRTSTGNQHRNSAGTILFTLGRTMSGFRKLSCAYAYESALDKDTDTARDGHVEFSALSGGDCTTVGSSVVKMYRNSSTPGSGQVRQKTVVLDSRPKRGHCFKVPVGAYCRPQSICRHPAASQPASANHIAPKQST